MRNKIPLHTKVTSILLCLAPIAAVSALGKADIWDQEIRYTQDKAADVEPVVKRAKSQKPKNIVRVAVGTNGLLERSGPRKNNQANGSAVSDQVLVSADTNQTRNSVDCHIPKPLRKRFSSLIEKVNFTSSKLSSVQFELGRVLIKSNGRDCHSLAFEYLEASADSGFARAFAELANAYKKGIGVTADFAKALVYYEKSANLGYANSAYRLIEMTEKGSREYPGNPVKASAYLDRFLPLIESKIQKGDAVAARSLARLYNNSNLIQRSPIKALRFMRLAADRNDPIAKHDLALLLIEHRRKGLRKGDILPLLIESSSQGYSAAFTAIGRLHLKREFGLPRNEAPTWFRSGVDAGHPGAMAELSELYFTGSLVARDVGLAKELALQGARLNHVGSKRMLQEIREYEKQEIEEG